MTRTIVDVAEEFRTRTLASGGATYLLESKTFASPGDVDTPTYVVGGVTGSFKLPLDTFTRGPVWPAVLESVRAVALHTFNASGIGTWIDGETVYVDVVDVYATLDKALEVARARGELAIFDLYTFDEIPVPREQAA